jgi:hypothetical protein
MERTKAKRSYYTSWFLSWSQSLTKSCRDIQMLLWSQRHFLFQTKTQSTCSSVCYISVRSNGVFRSEIHITWQRLPPFFSSLHIFPCPPASLALLNKLFCYQNIRILWAWFRKSQVALKRDQILFQIPPRDLRHQSQLLAPRHERLRPIPSRLSTISFIEFPL